MLRVCSATHAYLHEEKVSFVLSGFLSLKQRVSFCWQAFQERGLCWIKPPAVSLLLGTLAALTRGQAELLAENALSRQHLNIVRRLVKRLVS